MVIQTELCLSLTPGVANRLARHPLLSDSTPVRERIVDLCYDTPDLRLRREQVLVLCRKIGARCLAFVSKAGLTDFAAAKYACPAHWEIAREAGEPARFDFSPVTERRLRQWLQSLHADLQVTFTTSFTRNAWLLRPHEGVRIELMLDRGWIICLGRRQALCEIGLKLVSGSPKDLFSLASELQTDFSLHPEAIARVERSYRVLADESLPAVKSSPVRIDAGTSATVYFRRIALACLRHLQSNEQGLRQGDDPEFVHQARAAIRRLRSAIRIWRPLLPKDFVSRFDPRWRTLAEQLAEARHWEVFLTATLPTIAADLPEGVASARLANYAQRRSVINREAVRSTLQSDDYSRLLLEFTAAVLALPECEAACLEARARALLDTCAAESGRLAAQLLAGDDAAADRLRAAYKRLRYALEFFAPMFADQSRRDGRVAANGLPELLARLNELARAVHLTEEALPGEPGEAIRDGLERRRKALLAELRAGPSA